MQFNNYFLQHFLFFFLFFICNLNIIFLVNSSRHLIVNPSKFSSVEIDIPTPIRVSCTNLQQFAATDNNNSITSNNNHHCFDEKEYFWLKVNDFVWLIYNPRTNAIENNEKDKITIENHNFNETFPFSSHFILHVTFSRQDYNKNMEFFSTIGLKKQEDLLNGLIHFNLPMDFIHLERIFPNFDENVWENGNVTYRCFSSNAGIPRRNLNISLPNAKMVQFFVENVNNNYKEGISVQATFQVTRKTDKSFIQCQSSDFSRLERKQIFVNYNPSSMSLLLRHHTANGQMNMKSHELSLGQSSTIVIQPNTDLTCSIDSKPPIENILWIVLPPNNFDEFLSRNYLHEILFLQKSNQLQNSSSSPFLNDFSPSNSKITSTNALWISSNVSDLVKQIYLMEMKNKLKENEEEDDDEYLMPMKSIQFSLRCEVLTRQLVHLSHTIHVTVLSDFQIDFFWNLLHPNPLRLVFLVILSILLVVLLFILTVLCRRNSCCCFSSACQNDEKRRNPFISSPSTLRHQQNIDHDNKYYKSSISVSLETHSTANDKMIAFYDDDGNPLPTDV